MDKSPTYPQDPVDNSTPGDKSVETVHNGKGWLIRRRTKWGTRYVDTYWAVVTCSCGWETALCENEEIARARFREHRGDVAGQPNPPTNVPTFQKGA